MSARALIRRVPASFWRFGLVGVGGLFVDMAALYAAIWGAGLGAVAAKVFSFLVAATFTWWMNRRYTFGHSGKALLHEWASFLATNAVGGLVNFAVYTLLVLRWPDLAWMPALATAAGSVSGLMFNYLGSRHVVFQPPRRPEPAATACAPLPGVVYPLALAMCLGFGALALGLGMDASWDLRNYHWYNGWAFLHGVVGRDLLVSQTPSFFNPTLDAAYAFVAERLPARAVGFLLGMAHGLNFLPLCAIAWRLFPLADPRRRLAAALGLALAGTLGAGGLSEVGTVFYDDLLALPVLLAALLALAHWRRLAAPATAGGLFWAGLAGFPAGLAFGLKQTLVIYCVGLCAAFLLADMPWPRRLRTGFGFGVGVLAGFALAGGHWALHLWRAYGNPLFPFMNHIFRSPWGLPIDYRDPGFLREGWLDKLLLVYRFSFDGLLVGEVPFRDFRMMVLLSLLPVAACASFWRGRPLRLGPRGWLLAAAVVTYALWLRMFSIYRYLVPMEMLAPLLIAAAAALLPLQPKSQARLAAGLVGLCVATASPANWLRAPWQERAVPVALPALDAPRPALVLLSGHEPLSFLIPAFPETMRFYRIDSGFTLPGDPGGGFRKVFRDAIQNTPGPVASLHIVTERHEAVKKLAEYGLELDLPSCRPLTSPIGAGEYSLCLTRPQAGREARAEPVKPPATP